MNPYPKINRRGSPSPFPKIKGEGCTIQYSTGQPKNFIGEGPTVKYCTVLVPTVIIGKGSPKNRKNLIGVEPDYMGGL